MRSSLPRPPRRAFLALALLCFGSEAADFRSADVHPEGYPTVEAVKFMGRRLGELTGGRLGAAVIHGGALGTEVSTVEQVQIGALPMSRVNISALNDICPATLVPTMPFLFRDTAHLRAALDGPIGDEILASCAPQGLIGLAYYDSGSRSLYTSAKFVRNVSEARGLRLRVQNSALGIAVIEAMGARAVPIGYGEVHAALKSGRVDGAENNWSSFESAKHFEVATFHSNTEHSMAPEMLLFSKRVWDQLSPADQLALRRAAKESVPFMRELWDRREAAAKASVLARGVSDTEVDKASFQEAMKPVYAKFIRDPKLKDLARRIQELKAK